MKFLRVAAVTLITCGAITDACTAKTTEQWADVGCTVATVSGTDVAALGTIGAAANWNGCVASKITCSNNGDSNTAFTVDSSGIAENVCTALTADEWAAKGCIVSSPAGTTGTYTGNIKTELLYASIVIKLYKNYKTFKVKVTRLAFATSTIRRFSFEKLQ